MHACFIVLQLRSDSCQIHEYVMFLFCNISTYTVMMIELLWMPLHKHELIHTVEH